MRFESYGHSEINVIANHFYEREAEEEEKVKASKLHEQWQNVKCEMDTWKKQVPQALLEPSCMFAGELLANYFLCHIMVKTSTEMAPSRITTL